MGLLEEAREALRRVCVERGVDLASRVVVRPLAPAEAIGPEADGRFVLTKGKERVIEATALDGRGQSFTDQPAPWQGTLAEALALDLSNVPERAALVAAMNATLRSLGLAAGTLHCKDADPQRCGVKVAQALEARFGRRRIGLIGLQPGILDALAERFGPEAVRVLDLNPDNIGTVKAGVLVGDGERDLPALVVWCDVGLATGSTLVNGTIDDLSRRFAEAGKPLVFFGNTISGAAALLGIERLCPFGR